MAFLPGIQNFIKGGSNPFEHAKPYLNAIPQFGKEAYSPYIQQGQQAQQGLPNYQQMAQNPGEFYNELSKQYKPSQQYQNRYEQGMRAANSTAAAGGYVGTPDDQRGRGELVNKLMGEDFQQFLQNILGIQGFGAQGLENQANRGYNASGNLADYLGQANQNLASGEFAGKQQQQSNKYNLINSLIGAGAQGYGEYQGGKNNDAMMQMVHQMMGMGNGQTAQTGGNQSANDSGGFDMQQIANLAMKIFPMFL